MNRKKKEHFKSGRSKQRALSEKPVNIPLGGQKDDKKTQSDLKAGFLDATAEFLDIKGGENLGSAVGQDRRPENSVRTAERDILTAKTAKNDKENDLQSHSRDNALPISQTKERSVDFGDIFEFVTPPVAKIKRFRFADKVQRRTFSPEDKTSSISQPPGTKRRRGRPRKVLIPHRPPHNQPLQSCLKQQKGELETKKKTLSGVDQLDFAKPMDKLLQSGKTDTVEVQVASAQSENSEIVEEHIDSRRSDESDTVKGGIESPELFDQSINEEDGISFGFRQKLPAIQVSAKDTASPATKVSLAVKYLEQIDPSFFDELCLETTCSTRRKKSSVAA